MNLKMRSAGRKSILAFAVLISAFALQSCKSNGSGGTPVVGSAVGFGSCESGGSGGSGGSGFGGGGCETLTSLADVGPNDTVQMDGNVKFATYTSDLNTGETVASDTMDTAGEIQLTFNNDLLESATILADAASIKFDTGNGDTFTSSGLLVVAESADGEDFGIAADIDAAGFNYQIFGAWFTGFNTGSGVAAVGTFGLATASNDVPQIGTFLYQGGAGGFALDDTGTPFLVVSFATVSVDFQAQTFGFSTIGTEVADLNTLVSVRAPELNLAGGGAISGASLTGTLSAAALDLSGNLDGQFYGPNAEEVGGTFDLSGADGRYIGSFGAATP